MPLLLRILFLFPLLLAGEVRAGEMPPPPEFPKTWGSNNGEPVRAYYGEATNGLAAALRALPVVTIQMDFNDLFDPGRGIYANPLKTGSEWERPAALSLAYPDGRKGFEVNCGIRIQGGWNRRPEESPKHSFRIEFKKKYGPGKLRQTLFDGAEPRVFDELILRAGCNNTWLHWSGEERRRGDYIRDQWMRDSYRAMGHPSARGEFVHLYLNGAYWGIYNLTERPAASFAALHFGGKPDEYDARNGNNILSGDAEAWNKMFALVNAPSGLRGPEAYAAIGEWLDLEAFADFMLLNLYGANGDWDGGSNWYAARRRDAGGKFHFFVWDGERTLENPNDNRLGDDDDQSPLRLFQKLRHSAEFRKLFAARAQLHLQGKGALTPNQAGARFQQWADRLREAMPAEAVRWGSYRHDIHSYKTGPYEVYTREAHWEVEIRRILTEFFPARGSVLLKQLQTAGILDESKP